MYESMPTTSFSRKAVYPLLNSTQNAVKLIWPCQFKCSSSMILRYQSSLVNSELLSGIVPQYWDCQQGTMAVLTNRISVGLVNTLSLSLGLFAHRYFDIFRIQKYLIESNATFCWMFPILFIFDILATFQTTPPFIFFCSIVYKYLPRIDQIKFGCNIS